MLARSINGLVCGGSAPLLYASDDLLPHMLEVNRSEKSDMPEHFSFSNKNISELLQSALKSGLGSFRLSLNQFKLMHRRSFVEEINRVDQHRKTLLWYLATAGLYKCVEELYRVLSFDLNINGKCGELGQTILHYAVQHGHMEDLRLLLDIGVQPNQSDRYGRTALHYIALHGNTYENSVDVAKLLVDHDVSLKYPIVDIPWFDDPVNGLFLVSKTLEPKQLCTMPFWGKTTGLPSIWFNYPLSISAWEINTVNTVISEFSVRAFGNTPVLFQVTLYWGIYANRFSIRKKILSALLNKRVEWNQYCDLFIWLSIDVRPINGHCTFMFWSIISYERISSCVFVRDSLIHTRQHRRKLCYIVWNRWSSVPMRSMVFWPNDSSRIVHGKKRSLPYVIPIMSISRTHLSDALLTILIYR